MVGCLMFLAMVLTAGVARAEFGLFFVSIEGTRQGKLKGESLRPNAADKIEALGVSYEVLSSHDLATGQASGKRQHKPVTITKEWGAATPQLFQALVTNEILKTVLIEFIGVSRDGRSEVAHWIRLTNATVSHIREFTEKEQAGLRPLEEVSFTFQRIEINNNRGRTAATDDWTVR
jgi:type VI secretion system secreted protein Hcp